jgi:hypothetical protein
VVIPQFRLYGTQVRVGGGQFLECLQWYGVSLVLMCEIFILELLGKL